jgi:hypothetical protein
MLAQKSSPKTSFFVPSCLCVFVFPAVGYVIQKSFVHRIDSKFALKLSPLRISSM